MQSFLLTDGDSKRHNYSRHTVTVHQSQLRSAILQSIWMSAPPPPPVLCRAPGNSPKRPEGQSAISYDYSEEELMASIEREYCR